MEQAASEKSPGHMDEKSRKPWAWVPSLFFAEGMPYALVITVSVIMYKRLGLSNTDIALYTSWLYIPWIIKPLWSPFVEIFRTKRFWVVATQLLIGGALACLALAIPGPDFFRYTMAFFWILAFSSATHDIAADGFYMLGLKQYEQSAFIGIRTIFYRLASVTAQGGLVILAGFLENRFGSVANGWSATFFIVAGLFLAFCIYHFLVLPYPEADSVTEQVSTAQVFSDFMDTFRSFFAKKDILMILTFLFFYRFAEAQMLKMVSPFLLDDRMKGGLALSTSDVGIVYGTFAVVLSMTGGLIGGYAIYRKGLKYWIWIMAALVNLPDLLYVYLAWTMPDNMYVISACVAIEQMGYGFGFTAYTLFIIMISEGKYKTAHYAIATGVMALGMMIPGMMSGWIQDQLGYRNFFIWIMISTIPAFIAPALVKIDPAFGMKPKSK